MENGDMLLSIVFIASVLLIILLFNMRRKKIKQKKGKKKSLTIFKTVIIFGIIISMLVIFSISGYYILDQSYKVSIEEKKSLEDEFKNAQGEINASNFQLGNFEIELLQHQGNLEENLSELQVLKSGDKYHLHDPLWVEVLDFLENNETTDTREIIDSLKNQGIRCALAEIRMGEGEYVLIGFNTLDYGMLYIEPDTNYLVYPEVGLNYFDCVDEQPYEYPEPYDDYIITDILIIW